MVGIPTSANARHIVKFATNRGPLALTTLDIVKMVLSDLLCNGTAGIGLPIRAGR